MSIAAGPGIVFQNIGTGATAPFTLDGGQFTGIATATWGGGNVALQILAADGVTYVTVAAFTSAVTVRLTLLLPAGQYRFLVTTATAVYISLTNRPLE
jgi:hypothetical protein